MSLATGDLTTLATAKAYLASPPSDALLSGLITRMSRVVLSYLNRPLLIPHSYVEQYNGHSTTALVIPNWPLLSLTSLLVAGTAIQPAPQDSDVAVASNPYGQRFQAWDGVPPGVPAVIELVGGAYYIGGNQNVVVSYRAGYQVTAEAAIIPATPFQVTPLTPYGIWATDEGVTNVTTGAAMVAVASTPGPGQYVPPKPNATVPTSYYLFNITDVGTPISYNYGFVPADLEQVAIELIAERTAYRSRIGIRSQSLASQESMSFDLGGAGTFSGLPAYARAMLAPYRSTLAQNLGTNT